MNKRLLFLWALYDFANSIVFINFLLYFSQWLVIDAGVSDFWYNSIFALSSVLLLLSAPQLAAHTDRHGGRMKCLNIATIILFITYGLAAGLATFTTPSKFLVATLFLVGQYAYQFSFVFFNPLLSVVASPEYRARASGIGQFANSLGQIAGLLITLPLSGSRTAPLLPAVILFLVLALPMMVLFREPKVKEGHISSEVGVARMKSFFVTSLATPMLVSFFLFNDALLTVSNNFSIYTERVFAVADSTKSILLIGILMLSAVGGAVSGFVADRIGVLRTLRFILVGWIVAIPLMAMAPSFPVYAGATVALGLLLGSIWAVTRAYMTTILAPQEIGYGFSFYTLAERFATLMGPLTWGSLIAVLGTDPRAYRIAMGTMTVFVIAGLAVLTYWKRVPATHPATQSS